MSLAPRAFNKACNQRACSSCHVQERTSACCRCESRSNHTRDACQKAYEALLKRTVATEARAKKAIGLAKRMIWRTRDRANYTGSDAAWARHERAKAAVPAARRAHAEAVLRTKAVRASRADHMAACAARARESRARRFCTNPWHP